MHRTPPEGAGDRDEPSLSSRGSCQPLNSSLCLVRYFQLILFQKYLHSSDALRKSNGSALGSLETFPPRTSAVDVENQAKCKKSLALTRFLQAVNPLSRRHTVLVGDDDRETRDVPAAFAGASSQRTAPALL
jgi:hypothetical protein